MSYKHILFRQETHSDSSLCFMYIVGIDVPETEVTTVPHATETIIAMNMNGVSMHRLVKRLTSCKTRCSAQNKNLSQSFIIGISVPSRLKFLS